MERETGQFIKVHMHHHLSSIAGNNNEIRILMRNTGEMRDKTEKKKHASIRQIYPFASQHEWNDTRAISN